MSIIQEYVVSMRSDTYVLPDEFLLKHIINRILFNLGTDMDFSEITVEPSPVYGTYFSCKIKSEWYN